MPAQYERTGQCVAEQLGKRHGRVARVNVEQKHRELIATPARQHVARVRSHLVLEPAGDLHHELIARRLSQRIVHQPESIDVHEDDRELLSAPSAVVQRPVEALHEVATVWQSGKGVVEPSVLESELQPPAIFKLFGQTPVRRH